jgi:hypothetical protein
MPTLVADVAEDVDAVVAALLAAGYHWRNSASQEISVWRNSGERLVVDSPEAAVEQFRAGASLQLWLDETQDLAVAQVGGRVRLYFDGFSAGDVASCLSRLESQKLAYSVGSLE